MSDESHTLALTDCPGCGTGPMCRHRENCVAYNPGSYWPGQHPAPQPGWGEGRKDDGDKAPYHLLAPELMDSVAQVLAFGAKKYGARNWEKGMGWSRPFAAAMRHLWKWWQGEKADPETGFSHLWHAACCVMFLIAYEARNTGKDDRP